MNKLGLITILALAACQPDTKNLERKVDELNKKLDQVLAQGGRGGAGAAQPQRRAEPDRAKTYAVSIEGDSFDGPADAKVTLVKAYDYACPYCEKVRDTMDELRKKYGADLRVVYKQFVVHPQVATAPALAFCAASKQQKGHEMDVALWDKAFKNRQFDKDADGGKKCWEVDAGCPIVLGFAQEIGLNTDKFKADMKECQANISKDMKDLQVLGVGATPSFFVNGRFLSGAMPIENFSQLIDEELKKANERIQQGTPAAQYYQQWIMDKGLKTLEAPKQ